MSNVAIYIVGSILVAAGVAYGINLYLGQTWAVVAALIIIGLGLMGAVNHGRRRETSPEDNL